MPSLFVEVPIISFPGTFSVPPTTWTTPVAQTYVAALEHPTYTPLLTFTVAPDATVRELDVAENMPTYKLPLLLAVGLVYDEPLPKYTWLPLVSSKPQVEESLTATFLMIRSVNARSLSLPRFNPENVNVEAVSLELVMFATQRFAAEKPVVLNRVTDCDEPARSMVEGEVVNHPVLPLVHAPPVPPASVAQLSPPHNPDVPPTQY